MYTDSRLKFIINVAYYSAIALLVYLTVKFLFLYLLPFIIGLFITIMVQKPADYISRRTKIKKGYCAVALVVVEYLLLIGLISLLVFEAGNYIYQLATGDSELMNSVGFYVDKLLLSFENMPEYLSDSLKNFLNGFVGLLTEFAKQTIKGLPMFFTSLLVTIVASCYIAKDYDRFKISVESVINDKYKLALNEIKRLFNENIKCIIVGYFKIMLMTFVQLTIGFIILKVNNGVLYAALISVLDIFPILGTGMILVPWAIYSFVVSNYFLGFGLLILYTIVIIIRNIIEPKIIGKQIGLHPLIALVTVFIGLKLFGFLGIIIAPLLTMIIYKMYDKGIFKLLAK